MGKQTNARKRSSRYRGRSRSRCQKPVARRQSPFGLWLLLIGVLLAVGVWVLMRIPPGLLVMGSIAVLVVLILFIGSWFVLRYRPTPEELRQWQGQQMEAVRMEETAHMIGVRPLRREDLAHLGNKEFEYFTGVLLETMGVASDLECVGGARDGSIDLRGKDQFNRLFIVQCKRLFGGKVTPEQTRSFRGAMQRWSANEVWFVTTSFFTDQAADEVSDLTHLRRMVLVDGQKLVNFIHQH